MTFIKFMALKMRLRSQGSILVSTLSFCLCVPNLVRLLQTFLQIWSENHFKWHPWPWKERQGHEVQTLYSSCAAAPVHQIWLGYVKYFFRYWAETIFFMLSTWMTYVTLKLRSRSPGSNMIFVLPCCFCVPKLVKIPQIVFEILSRNHLAYAHPPASYNATT